MKKYIVGVIVLVLVGGGAWWAMKPSAPAFIAVIEKDITMQGDYMVPAGSTMVIKNGATLTVNGDFEVQGGVTCEGGPLRMVSNKALTISGSLICNRAAMSGQHDAGVGISLVAQGPLTLADSSVITTNGDFTITSDTVVPQEHAQSLISIAYAQGTETIGMGFGGTVKMEKLQWKKDPLVMIYAGKGREVVVTNWNITGADGADGKDNMDASCSALGGKGNDATRMRVVAPSITLVGAMKITLGEGGRGGNARTIKNCDQGVAVGGAGGLPGSITLDAPRIIIKDKGALQVQPGLGGHGGTALAYGKQGAPTEKGGDATARGGEASASLQPLRIMGSVDRHVMNSIIISNIHGGLGGDAFAYAGKGGESISCPGNAQAGPGGRAFAQAGAGGAAAYVLTDALPEGSSQGKQNGGKGGNADAQGGAGGLGLKCDKLDGTGGNGGKGGNATAVAALGGNGKDSLGEHGTASSPAGNGGDGGDACHPGQRAIGGSGKPDGAIGKDGVKKPDLCPKPQTPENPPKKKPIIIETPRTQPPVETKPETGGGGSSSSGVDVTGYFTLQALNPTETIASLVLINKNGPDIFGLKADVWAQGLSKTDFTFDKPADCHREGERVLCALKEPLRKGEQSPFAFVFANSIDQVRAQFPLVGFQFNNEAGTVLSGKGCHDNGKTFMFYPRAGT